MRPPRGALPLGNLVLVFGVLVGCQCGSSGPAVVSPPPNPTLGSGTPGPAIRSGTVGGRPIILYSDLQSAPAGAFVTFWGRDFGEAGAGGRIQIGEQAISTIVRWSPTQIEARLPADARSGAVVVTTGMGASPPYAMRVHRGSLWFVATSGSDAAAGSEEHPFGTIPKGIAALRPGDVLYIRGGTYVPPPNREWRAHVLLHEMANGTAEAPVAIVGYPGESVVIGDNRTEKIFSFEHDPPFEYVTIAKLGMLPTCLALETGRSRHIRIVANEITGSRAECADGTLAIGGGSDIKVLGNDIHDNGGPKLKSCVYLSGFGETHDVEVAYNRLRQQSGGRAIQMYGHLDDDTIRNVWIHSNEITEVDRDAILVGHTDANVLHAHDILIANNVIRRAGRCVGWAIRVDNPTAENIQIVHNTLVSNGMGNQACDESVGEPMAQIGVERGRSVSILNNILVSEGRGGLVQILDPRAALRCSHNLYFGDGDACRTDDGPILGAPGFANPATFDFRLTPGSPAVDAASPSVVTVDAAGVARPSGAAPDVGALELSR